MNRTSSHRLGVVLVASAALWWSTGGLFLRAVHTDPWTTIFWRSAFAFSTMFLFIAIRKRKRTLAHFRALLTSVANALILQSLSPFVAAILGFMLMGERIALRTWIAMLVSAFGVYVMVANAVGGGSPLGNLLGFAIAVFYGGAVVVTRYNHGVQMLPASCLATIFAMILSLSVLTLSGHSPLEVDGHDLLLLACFGAFQLAGGMLLFTYGVRLIPAAESALLSFIETIAAPIWVFVFFDENPGLRALLGGAIVLVTVIVYTSLNIRRQAQLAAIG